MFLETVIAGISHSLLCNMSKRTSEELSNSIEVLDPNNLEGEGDEEEAHEGSESDATAYETPALGGDDFMHTDDFRRLFVDFIMVDTLVAMRWLDRKWHKVVEKKLIEFENEPFGEIIVHGGNDISAGQAISRNERMKQVTKVVDRAFLWASILVEVDIPEGITIIGNWSFRECSSLKYITFPTSLTTIGEFSFHRCSSLEQVDILHTKVQTLGKFAFRSCTSLKEMKVPDSFQWFGHRVFCNCSKLVPSDINVNYDTEAVVAYLRSIQ
ncbi:hypothetical protein TrST_g7708 [Triparma strigata]|uniref:Uncharacterized protein n=1 Tax=Triparma strigata TaxID=1606541 RepID=A0A9W7E2P5_9STRA|nr:hypothetical protein TrST_g7708 [Triparma strigata]